MLTLERLKQVLSYDPHTGIFIRISAGKRTDLIGSVAGSISNASLDNGGGYRAMQIDGCRYYAHRLAWFYMRGEWPIGQIDHINMDRADNRLINLRDVSRSENNANREAHANNPTGLKGVTFKAGRKRPWRARIRKDGVEIFLGYFGSPEEAHQAYSLAAHKAYGASARH